MEGKRFVICAETEENRKLATNLVKNLTGGDTITARKLHKDQRTFEPTHTIWIFSNYAPTIKDQSDALWNRLKKIPFNVNIIKTVKKREIEEVLASFKNESSGILNWALEGYKQGIGEMPDIVQKVTSEYRSEMDEIGRFLSERCEEDSKDYIVLKSLYADYEFWCIDTGEECVSKKAIIRYLVDRDYVSDKIKNNQAIYRGLKLKEEPWTGLEMKELKKKVKKKRAKKGKEKEYTMI